MPTRDDVCVLIPTYNEAAAIGEVIDGFHDQDLQNVLVIDGGSDDDTQQISADHGARVVEQSGSGKGQAVREAFEHIDAPYVLMVDGDGTYRPEDAHALLEPLLSDEADHVIGNRFADMESGAMTRLNRVGNRLINRAFETIHGRNFVDILSGYRAMTRESIERFDLSSEGFGIETELSVECVKHNVTTEIVPIRYESRPDETETNLRPFRDGGIILLTLYRMAKTNNPLFYFGSVGIASLLAGGGLGTYVGVEWFTRGISHNVLAMVGGIAIVFGVQLLMFGTLSDMVLKLHREQMHRLDQVLDDDRDRDERSRE
ncbi:Glycosyl transferase protein [Halorhabdus tiamatea SARL4B]|uniref:Glycosyl transferase protein n=1 Tax=Halorhabdus tiamatea SARL4B TaxID=1033806 RepID=F7PIN9_9EURY|nr:S-layer glycoprotein N-glycosyltransferase AglJ [Halorhabdus tiamatea]ERJ06993.1 Glycosyl transferase protein [Halorhabdus tiamatea SARL4B]CCQ34765.1 glycosyltransferase [Halorhabdus tiamatea SARL4B]